MVQQRQPVRGCLNDCYSGVYMHCGENRPDKCMSCRQRCFSHLCLDCGETYGKESVAEKEDNRKIIDTMLRSDPGLLMRTLMNR